MLTAYINKAMKRASCRKLDDGTFFGEIPGFQGVWANAGTLQACRRELREVLEEWLLMKLRDGDEDIPELGGITLAVKKESA
ncbi:MAG: type II toxin-antitoxin system HicB family antitoxin [Chloroflexi bacterium]|nr:type II toxin-antitoxin system HicB family antitoxin [Chloroflexota bacterium]